MEEGRMMARGEERAHRVYEQIVRTASIRSISLPAEDREPQKGLCIIATGPARCVCSKDHDSPRKHAEGGLIRMGRD